MTVEEYIECDDFYYMAKHGTIEYCRLANNLYDFHIGEHFKEKGNLDALYKNAHIFAILDVFEAGRITGIREERAKRKKKKKGQQKKEADQ